VAEAYLHAKFDLDPSSRSPKCTNVTERQDTEDRTDNGPIA